MPGVWVVLKQGDVEKARALTTDDGRYFMPNLDAGVYTISVLRDKEVLFSNQVTLAPGATVAYDIALR